MPAALVITIPDAIRVWLLGQGEDCISVRVVAVGVLPSGSERQLVRGGAGSQPGGLDVELVATAAAAGTRR